MSRYYASYLYNLFMRAVLGTRIDDNLTGFFAAPRAALFTLEFDKIFFGYGDYFFRLLLKSQERGFRHVQIPRAIWRAPHGRRKNADVSHLLGIYARGAARCLDESYRQMDIRFVS